MRPPVEWPMSTTSRGDRPSPRWPIATSAASMSSSYVARSATNPGVWPGRRLRPYLRRSSAWNRAPCASQKSASSVWKK
ncbi:Uncharacterised protein [Mycobacteroides abscessus]|nr:Uncharacterised protein [Mycobacteroides abscessus]